MTERHYLTVYDLNWPQRTLNPCVCFSQRLACCLIFGGKNRLKRFGLKIRTRKFRVETLNYKSEKLPKFKAVKMQMLSHDEILFHMGWILDQDSWSPRAGPILWVQESEFLNGENWTVF